MYYYWGSFPLLLHLRIELKKSKNGLKNLFFDAEFGQNGRMQGYNKMILEYLQATQSGFVYGNIHIRVLRSTE